MTDSRPLIPVNTDGLDDLATSLLNASPATTNIPTTANIRNPDAYIILPEKKHGTYSYPNILVAKRRVGYDADAEKAAKQLGLQLQNNDQGFIGNINWEQALLLNLYSNNETLNPRQFVDFLLLLREGIDGKVVHDGSGKPITKNELQAIYDDITTQRSPYRGEWLDAKFTESNGVLHINYGHKVSAAKLTPQKSEPLESHLEENAYIELASANRHGVPTIKSTNQEIYYWHPANSSVAWFRADSVRVILDCDGDPQFSVAGLGVRAAKIRK